MQTLKTRFAALAALAVAAAFCAPAPAQTYRENNPVIGKELSDTHFDKGVAETGKFTLKPATAGITGAVKPDGTTTTVNASGTLSVNAAGIASGLPLATTSVKGVVTLATAAEAPSTSDQEAATPAYVNAAIAASPAKVTGTSVADAVAADTTAQASLAASLADDLGATAAETIAGTEAVKFISPDDLHAALQDGAAYQLHTAHTYTSGPGIQPNKTNITWGTLKSEGRLGSVDGTTITGAQGEIYDGGVIKSSASMGFVQPNAALKTALFAQSFDPGYLAAYIKGDVRASRGQWVYGDGANAGKAEIYAKNGIGFEPIGNGVIVNISQQDYEPFALNRNGSDGVITIFSKNANTVGAIDVSATGTSYSTVSDHRLKTVTGPLTGSGAFIDALKPKVGEWKAEPGKKAAFLIAHEAQAVSPSSVTGTKDAVDKDGKPIMQSVAYGSAEMIVNIVAELQSLRKRLAANDAEISALKAGQK